jgi:hypothetical protein
MVVLAQTGQVSTVTDSCPTLAQRRCVDTEAVCLITIRFGAMGIESRNLTGGELLMFLLAYVIWMTVVWSHVNATETAHAKQSASECDRAAINSH